MLPKEETLDSMWIKPGHEDTTDEESPDEMDTKMFQNAAIPVTRQNCSKADER